MCICALGFGESLFCRQPGLSRKHIVPNGTESLVCLHSILSTILISFQTADLQANTKVGTYLQVNS